MNLITFPRMIVRPLGVVGAGGGTYSISGAVFDADGSTPVEGATVALGALSAVSAADGSYTISNVPPGTSGSMTCTLAGYLWTAITIAAMSGNLTGQDYTNVWYLAGAIPVASIYGAWQAKGAASLAASYVNLANPGTNDLTVGAAPGWSADVGWQYTGAQYLRTGLTPAGTGRYSGFIKVSALAQNSLDGGMLGYYSSSSRAFCIYKSATTNKAAFRCGAGGTLVQSAAAVVSGVFGLYGQLAYQDGSNIGDTGVTNQSSLMQEILIGTVGTDADVDALGYFIGNMQAAILFNAGVTLTGGQLSILQAAMANF